MPVKKASLAVIPIERIERRIHLIRSQRVILSADLAKLYGVPVRTLNQAVSRHKERFPDDFMFQLTKAETEALSRSQSVILNDPGGGRFKITTCDLERPRKFEVAN